MRVLVLNPYLYGTAGGPRSGLELWERVLRPAGISFHYAPFETERLHAIVHQPRHGAAKAAEMLRAYIEFIPKVSDLSAFDAVLISREATLIGPALIERWIALRNKPIIYILDDPHYIAYRSPTSGWFSYLKFFGKVKTLCRISNAVIVNSPSHHRFASQFSTNVWEIPSVVDASVYDGWRPGPAITSDHVCIGWSGSPSTVENLQVIRNPLASIAKRVDVSVRLIGAKDFRLPDVPHVGTEWRAETEVDDLRKLDVGLLPLPLTPWTPHKFYLKLVQYMALGIPPVATPLGANPRVISNGETGFLAETECDWNRILTRLIEDAELRETVGRRAAKVAHERYTLQANAPAIQAAFRSVGL
jgi:L-malate glycosyltransferase